MPQNAFFPRTRNLLVSQKTTQRHFFSILHPLSMVIFATATVLACVLLRDSRWFHCYTQREATPTQKSARKCAATSRDVLRKRLQSAIHSSKPASLNHPISIPCYAIHSALNTQAFVRKFLCPIYRLNFHSCSSYNRFVRWQASLRVRACTL